MKKLVFAVGCFAAILLTSSCTADSTAEAKNENLTNFKQSVIVNNVSAIDDTDPPRPR